MNLFSLILNRTSAHHQPAYQLHKAEHSGRRPAGPTLRRPPEILLRHLRAGGERELLLLRTLLRVRQGARGWHAGTRHGESAKRYHSSSPNLSHKKRNKSRNCLCLSNLFSTNYHSKMISYLTLLTLTYLLIVLLCSDWPDPRSLRMQTQHRGPELWAMSSFPQRPAVETCRGGEPTYMQRWEHAPHLVVLSQKKFWYEHKRFSLVLLSFLLKGWAPQNL